MTKQLRFAHNLSLPLDAVTQRFAFLGRIGSGKTYAATKLIELMLEAGAQVAAIDPVGKCYGLRVPGTGPAFDIPVFGGLHGDIPLEPTAGALMADVVVDRALSCVIDVSQFATDAEKARFAAAFAERFYFRKKAAPSAVHIFLEECQEFVPQNPAKGEEMMLHHWTRMAKLGRNFGIGISLASQRPQEVNKKVLNLSEVLVAFQLRGKHEREAVKDWITEKDSDKAILDELPKLAVGDAILDSPQWLGTTIRVRALPKRTADVSATPKLGEAPTREKPMSAVDLGALREKMAETIERAKADDPKVLRAEIASLKKQLAAAPSKERVVEKSVVDERAVARAVAAAVKPWQDKDAKVIRLIQRVGAAHRSFVEAFNELADAAGTTTIAAPVAAVPERRPVAAAPSRPAAAQRHAARPVTAGYLTGAKLKIVRALAELEAIGVERASRAQLGFYVGMTFSGGYGSNTLGAMRTEGLIDYPEQNHVALTDAGRAEAGEVDVPVDLDDLHARVRRHLTGLQERIFDAVLALGKGGAVSREELGEQLGATFSGGYGSNTLGALRTAGLIAYPQNGMVGPSDLLFPEGLI